MIPCVDVAGSSMVEALSQPFPRALSHPAALEQQKYALTGMQVSTWCFEYPVRQMTVCLGEDVCATMLAVLIG
jgi:hypothetical protein